jgi:hypothetical protein
MNKKFTRKEFMIFVGSLIGLFVVSRIPAPDSIKNSFTKKFAAGHSYGSGSYGGSHTS